MFTSSAALPHPVGLVGQHRSTRVGGGTELAEIRPFRTGDRLRRIHWPVSLRTGALHVTTTYADQDAEVRLVLDAIRDLGERDLETGRRSSLDVAVEAAGAVAAHYLTTGDRVGLSVLGGAGVVEVPAVGGHHQLARVLLGLGRAEPSRGTVGEERALRAQLRRSIPPGAFVVLLSALVSAEPLAHAVRLARSGHAVVVVDTLPPELARRRRRPTTPCARSTGVEDARLARLVWRLRLLDREREAHQCAMAGVPVIAWRGPGFARHRAAPGGPPIACAREWPADDPQPHLAPRDGGHRPGRRRRHPARRGRRTCPASCPSPLGALVVATWWALARPAGWGAFTLVVVPGARARPCPAGRPRPSCSGRWPRRPARR